MLETLSERERSAVAHYNQDALDGNTADTPIWVDEFMFAAFSGTRDGDEIIDVGCGLGRAIPLIEDLGYYRIFGIDPAEEAVRYCREQFPGHSFAEDEIRTIGDHYPDRFDAFFLGTVLMHIPREDILMALKSLRKCLRHSAQGFFSTPYGTPEKLEVTNRVGMVLTLFTIEEIRNAFEACGFRIRALETADHMMKGAVEAI